MPPLLGERTRWKLLSTQTDLEIAWLNSTSSWHFPPSGCDGRSYPSLPPFHSALLALPSMCFLFLFSLSALHMEERGTETGDDNTSLLPNALISSESRSWPWVFLNRHITVLRAHKLENASVRVWVQIKVCETENEGHFSVAYSAYTHFEACIDASFKRKYAMKCDATK